MAVPAPLILGRLQEGVGFGPEHRRSNVAYHLMNLILREKAFDTLEDLQGFCAEGENLSPWFPRETDRRVFSNELSRQLRAMNSQFASSS